MESMVQLRPGAVDKGRIYEQKMAALLATKLSLDRNVEDFWMLSNIGGVGDFDDLVISVLDRCGTRCLYFIQFKHIEKETLQVQQLESGTSDFSLSGYQKTFDILREKIGKGMFVDYKLENTFLVLHTNAKLLGGSQKMNIINERGPSLMETSSQFNTIFRVRNSDKDNPFLDEAFLSRFYIYSRQANASKLDELIKSILFNHFTEFQNTSVFSLTHFFTIWSLGRKSKIKTLQKKYLQMNLMELILLPYVMDPNVESATENNNADIIRRTVLSFNVVPITQESSLHKLFAVVRNVIEDVCEIKIDASHSWNAHLSQEQLDIVYRKSEDHRKEQFLEILRDKSQYTPHITVKDLYLTAWQCRLVPLILNCQLAQDTIENTLFMFEKVTPNLSFVLLNSNFTVETSNLSVFQTFNDIEDLDLQREHFTNMKISLQCKSPILIKDVNNNFNIVKEINPDILLSLSDGPLQIGLDTETESYYVQRKIHPQLISTEILNKEIGDENDDNLFVITSPDTLVLLKYSEASANLSDYIENSDYLKDSKLSILLAGDLEIESLKTAVDSLASSTSRSVHLLRFLEEKFLEWIYSAGSIEKMQQFVVESANCSSLDISEGNINLESNLTLLSSHPGMGKTMFLRSIANKYQPTTWVSYLQLREHISDIANVENMGQFVQYHFKYETSGQEEFARKFSEAVYLTCMQNKQVVLLLDGYDEVAGDDFMAFLKAVVSSGLVKMWISTRSSLKNFLEKSFKVLSLELSNFTDDDRGIFLTKYFSAKEHVFHFSMAQVESIVGAIDTYLKNIADVFMNVPLYIKMLGEVFADDLEKITERQNMSLVQLYDIYINIELRQYKSYEASILRQIISKLALKLFYFPEQLEGIVDYNQLLGDLPAFHKNHPIITNINKDGKVSFAHQSYAEFLAADLISSKLESEDEAERRKYAELTQNTRNVEVLSFKVLLDKMVRKISPISKADLKKAEHAAREGRDNVVEELKRVETDVRAAREQVVEVGKKLEKHGKKIKKLFR